MQFFSYKIKKNTTLFYFLLLPYLLYAQTSPSISKERVYTIRLFSSTSIEASKNELQQHSLANHKEIKLYKIGSYIVAQYGISKTPNELNRDLKKYIAIGFEHAIIMPTTTWHMQTEEITQMPKYPQSVSTFSPVTENKKIPSIEPPKSTYISIINHSKSITLFFRHFLIIGILFFVALSLITIIVLFIHKIKIESKIIKIENLKNFYRDQLTLSLFAELPEHTIPTLHKELEYEAFSDIVIELLETFNDPLYKSVLHNALIQYGVLDHYLNIAISNQNTNQRLNAVDRLAMCHYEQNHPFFLSLINDPSADISIRNSALTGLSFILNPEESELFLSALNKTDTSGKFTEYLLSNTIQRFIELDNHMAIITIFYWLQLQSNYLTLKAFIEAISIIGYESIIPELQELYFMTVHDSIKITIVRALGAFGHITDKTILANALKSNNETLRIVAAKSLSSYKGDDLTYLSSLHLSDDSFYVRYNISRSLSKLNGGIDILHTIATSGQDLYAKECAIFSLHLIEDAHA